eukprot:gene7921-1134_t
MLYGRYPFELGHAENVPDVQKSFQMLQRMESEDYQLNPSVLASDECLDLLKRLLKPVAANRITLGEVMQHPWFLKKLPPKACEMNRFYLSLPPPEHLQSPDCIKQLLDQGRHELELYLQYLSAVQGLQGRSSSLTMGRQFDTDGSMGNPQLEATPLAEALTACKLAWRAG